MWTALIALASAAAELAGYGVTGKAQPDIAELVVSRNCAPAKMMGTA